MYKFFGGCLSEAPRSGRHLVAVIMLGASFSRYPEWGEDLGYLLQPEVDSSPAGGQLGL